MRKFLLASIILALAIVVPLPARAEVNINIGIAPPPFVFGAPPAVIVLPDTSGVYVVPDIEADLFFWDGWWWRPWGGGWYRSPYYDSGWGYYSGVPVFYYDVEPRWRVYYREQNWYGHRWAYERIPNQELHRNWKTWDRDRYWEKNRVWGVEGYKPRPKQEREELRHRREEQYQNKPEVRRHREQVQDRKKQERKGDAEHRKPEQQHRSKISPEEKERGRTLRPQGGSSGRGEQQHLHPAENRGHEGGPAPQKERRKAPPEKREKPGGPEGGHESRDMR